MRVWYTENNNAIYWYCILKPRVFNSLTKIYLQFETVINMSVLTDLEALKFWTVLISDIRLKGGGRKTDGVGALEIGLFFFEKGEERSNPLGETWRWVVSRTNAVGEGGFENGGLLRWSEKHTQGQTNPPITRSENAGDVSTGNNVSTEWSVLERKTFKWKRTSQQPSNIGDVLHCLISYRD